MKESRLDRCVDVLIEVLADPCLQVGIIAAGLLALLLWVL